MLVTAATTLPLGWAIVIAVVPLLISALALIGGWKQQSAARTEQAREHAAALEQQREQLTANLSHDREQQARMLEHERRQDDLREARGVVDEAARALHEANRAWRKLLGDADARRMKEEFREAVRAVEEVGQRIAIRFGREHPVTKAFNECVDGMPDALDAVDREDEDNRHRVGEAGQKLRQALPVFIEAATSYAGVDLSPRPT
jgi:CRISPR/Cas system CSM-associated protein Csm2 small subunit